MLQERFRKKFKIPSSGNDSSVEMIDVGEQVPEVDEVLAEVDKALENARKLEKQLRPVSRCGC